MGGGGGRVQRLKLRFREVQNLFVDEFSFLPYELLHDIHELFCRYERSEACDAEKPYARVNIFFRSFRRLQLVAATRLEPVSAKRGPNFPWELFGGS